MSTPYIRPAWAKELREEAANVCAALATIWADNRADDFSIDAVCTILEVSPIARLLVEDALLWAYLEWPSDSPDNVERWVAAEALCRKENGGDSLVKIP